jgi:3-oxoacyl-[acyl-carrier protein] reductase
LDDRTEGCEQGFLLRHYQYGIHIRYRGFGQRGEYCVAKAGIAMMNSLFAARLGEYDIPVYEVRPGVTKTDMTSGVTEKYDKLIAEGLCVTPRWGFPEDVGKAVASLAEGNFPYSTGQVIMVDGGLTLPRL